MISQEYGKNLQNEECCHLYHNAKIIFDRLENKWSKENDFVRLERNVLIQCLIKKDLGEEEIEELRKEFSADKVIRIGNAILANEQPAQLTERQKALLEKNVRKFT